MQNLFKRAILPMMVSGGALLWGASAAVNAATFIDLGNAAGVQCATTAVNDSGQAVGNCTLSDPSANLVPWFSASSAGPQQALPSLVANQPCTVTGIANNGSMLGTCADANNLSFAVTWKAVAPSAPPVKLQPLAGTILFPLLRPADVQTVAVDQNEQGAVVGWSVSGGGENTVVVYLPGTATPVRVSGWSAKCSAAGVNNTLINGYPSILMNCTADGKDVPRIATWVAGAYALMDLPVASGASYCWAVDMNDQNQAVGSCVFPTAGKNINTAFWPSPTSAPRLLTLPQNAKNSGIATNNAGHVLARGMDPSGFVRDFYWADTSSSFAVRPIKTLPDSDSTSAFTLAENDTVAMDCFNSQEYPTACTWDPINETVPIPPINGGRKSILSSISFSGTRVAGVVTDASRNDTAVVAELP